MTRRLLLVLFAAVLSGCASFDEAEIATIRTRGVSPSVVAKLDRGDPVAPADVIELRRRGVPDAWVIRQIEDHGVDSLVSRNDMAALRREGVRAPVLDALLKASDRFADRYRYGDPFYDPWVYGDPYLGFYDPYPSFWYGGVGATIVMPRHHHLHRHRR